MSARHWNYFDFFREIVAGCGVEIWAQLSWVRYPWGNEQNKREREREGGEILLLLILIINGPIHKHIVLLILTK